MVRVRDSRGFTLIEMMVVIAIVGAMLSVAALGFRNLTKADLRSGASRTAATMRFAFDRALMTGAYVRMAIDLERGRIWLEVSHDRVSLRAGREQHATNKPTEDEEAQGDDTGASGPKGPMGLGLGLGLGGGSGGDDEDGAALGIDVQAMLQAYERDLKPQKRPRARFSRLRGFGAKELRLKSGVVVAAVMTARMEKPVDRGMAFIYFFPQGHTEPSIVHLKTDGDDPSYYSVVLHPLTGHAKIYSCRYRIPEEFGQEDDSQGRRRKRDVCEKRP